MGESLKSFTSKLKREKTLFPKTIIYGRTFAMRSNIYLLLKEILGQDFVYPSDAPDIPQFCIVDMFTGVTEPDHNQISLCDLRLMDTFESWWLLLPSEWVWTVRTSDKLYILECPMIF